MHSPASNNDKDPYEVKCHIRAQCSVVGPEPSIQTFCVHNRGNTIGISINVNILYFFLSEGYLRYLNLGLTSLLRAYVRVYIFSGNVSLSR